MRVEIVTTAVQPSRPELLGPADLARWRRLRREADRDRLSTGAVLRQAVLRERAGRAVPVVRRCRGCGSTDHGEVQPAAPEDLARWRTSTSHAGGTVALAVVDCEGADVGVGLDVEAVSRTDLCIAPLVLCDGEQPPTSRWDLCGLWTAKEAVLKALGCGLHVAMTEVEVRPHAADGKPGWTAHAAGEDSRLQPLREQPCRVVDLTYVVGGSQRSAVAVTGADHTHVEHRQVASGRWLSWVESMLPDE
ncbi:MAG: 4'-phosphopantetheinyl transferase superfamily protein [Micrococcales bacterium]|nr:4'-phosphopantetheinyl transferase superfamily protein [Micrococcales bacterium]MCL2668762.1 4'-phosphopantetheinyl transferase superfamily protein [Micrococcales bacterium]